MYTEQDYTAAGKKMKKELYITIGLLMAFLAAMCVGLAFRIKPLVLGAPVVGGWVFFTLWTVKCMPWIRYNRFLSEMKEGRRRVTECFFWDVAGRVRIVDGVQIHDVNASLDEHGEDLRLFYWDDDKPLPQIEKGRRVRITSYGNFITGIEEI